MNVFFFYSFTRENANNTRQSDSVVIQERRERERERDEKTKKQKKRQKWIEKSDKYYSHVKMSQSIKPKINDKTILWVNKQIKWGDNNYMER